MLTDHFMTDLSAKRFPCQLYGECRAFQNGVVKSNQTLPDSELSDTLGISTILLSFTNTYNVGHKLLEASCYGISDLRRKNIHTIIVPVCNDVSFKFG